MDAQLFVCSCSPINQLLNINCKVGEKTITFRMGFFFLLFRFVYVLFHSKNKMPITVKHFETKIRKKTSECVHIFHKSFMKCVKIHEFSDQFLFSFVFFFWYLLYLLSFASFQIYRATRNGRVESFFFFAFYIGS